VVPDNGLGKTTEVAILEPAAGSMLVPAMVAAAGERAVLRFIENLLHETRMHQALVACRSKPRRQAGDPIERI